MIDTIVNNTFDCDFNFTQNAPISPLKMIRVVCKNGHKINICDSGGMSCDHHDFFYEDFTGNDTCNYYGETENKEFYFSNNTDGRIGLGLYYYDDTEGIYKSQLKIDTLIENVSLDDKAYFTAYTQPELIDNGNGNYEIVVPKLYFETYTTCYVSYLDTNDK